MERADPSPRPAPKLGQIVAALTEGWRCPACQYDLQNQAVHVEPTYQFLVSRCPECGRVWPVQMQELKPKTRRTIGFVSVVVWGAFVLAGILGTAFFQFGMAASATDRLRWENDPVSWASFVMSLFLPVVLFPTCVIAALGLPHLNTRRLLALALVPMALAFVFIALYHLIDDPDDIELGEIIVSVVHLVIGYTVFAACVLAARPTARAFAWLFMSTRLKIAVSGLWTASGKTPPFAEPTAES